MQIEQKDDTQLSHSNGYLFFYFSHSNFIQKKKKRKIKCVDHGFEWQLPNPPGVHGIRICSCLFGCSFWFGKIWYNDQLVFIRREGAHGYLNLVRFNKLWQKASNLSKTGCYSFKNWKIIAFSKSGNHIHVEFWRKYSHRRNCIMTYFAQVISLPLSLSLSLLLLYAHYRHHIL